MSFHVYFTFSLFSSNCLVKIFLFCCLCCLDALRIGAYRSVTTEAQIISNVDHD